MSVPTSHFAPRSPDRVRSIGDAIARRAEAAGASPALVGAEAGDITFSQLRSCISCLAGQLANAGLQREDRVGLLIPPGVSGGQLIVALASNVALVPLNPALTAHELVEAAKVGNLKAVVIPRWLETHTRAALLEQGIVVLEAVLAAQDTLRLDLLTPATGASIGIRPARASDVALLLRSSGTTGAPKLIPVTHGNLLAMAGKLGSALWFNLTAQDRAACMLPLYYAAGLKTSLFVPLILGASVGFPPTGEALDLARWFDILKPTYLSVAPASLNGILDRLRASTRDLDCGSLRFVMCAAAYLPEEVRLAAEAALRVPILEFYGLSEAGVMAANPAPPGVVKPGTVGLPAPGDLRIVDEKGKPAANGTVGEIVISGPTVTPGYVMTGNSSPAGWTGGWLPTGDLGRIDEDGYLTIVGRLKEVINRGGEKVFPYEIEKAILQHPAVLEAAAFGVPHPRLGESVAAAAVLKPGSTVCEEELKAFLAARLAGFKLPRRLYFASQLPRGNTGKVLRSALAQAYADARHEFVRPDRLIEWELRDIWKRLLGTDDIGIDDDFFEKGGDSLLATEMLIEVELLAGKPYPPSELSTLTIRRMAAVITSALAPPERKLVTQVKSGPGIPLFFCHGDYVTRGIYAQRIAALLPGDRPIYLLNCYADHSLGSSMENIAHAYLEEVLRAAPRSPVIVGGYCNGGLAAWHLAHLLRSRGEKVVELLLVETMSLNARPALRRLPRFFEAAGSVLPGRAGRVLRSEAMREAWTWGRRIGGLSYRATREGIASALRREPPSPRRRDVFDRADQVFLGLMSRYVPPRIDVDVTCFIAAEGRHFDTDPRLWRRLANNVEEVIVPGTHHTAVVSGRKALATAMADAMERVTARYLLPAGERSEATKAAPRPADASA